MTFQFRDYQEKAIETGVRFFEKNSGKNEIEVLPTGAGKSLVIAGISTNAKGNTLVLQPSKEILEQNYKKAQKLLTGEFKFGNYDLGVYSASVGVKRISKITFATIGSIVKKPELFRHFDRIIQDECDLTNAKGGMYANFFNKLGKPVMGLTATPYRLHPPTTYNNSVLKMLHRTRPRQFYGLSHITQPRELVERGYLCPLRYHRAEFDAAQLTLNSTGAEFTDDSVKHYAHETGTISKIIRIVKDVTAPSILIFVNSLDEARTLHNRLLANNMESVVLTGETPKDEREHILADFTTQKQRILINVGVLTVGFDYTALTCIIMARITNSLRLYYQIGGRGQRISPETGKEYCDFFDLGGNVQRFGKIEDFEIVGPAGKERLKCGGKFLTGVDLKTGLDLEQKRENESLQLAETDDLVVHFGKHKGQKINTLPRDYLQWIADNFSDGAFKKAATTELARRAGSGLRMGGLNGA
ncbi:MAG: DEAD/DEAH box helicase [Patescibacteria group bacterium]|nr:DEAD/DEAH box helicase [Patescibacteria group bacterium]